MPLTLKIISPSPLPQGQSQECLIDELGGTIGRKPHNSFVLVDPERFISSQHADIAYKNGEFLITDTSTNGVFINGSSQPLGASNSHSLSDGDKISIGDFQLQVSVNAQTGDVGNDLWEQQPSAGNPSPPANDDPISMLQPSTPANSFEQELPISTNITSEFFGESSPNNSVDPMALLDGSGPSSTGSSAPDDLGLLEKSPNQAPFSDLDFAVGNSITDDNSVDDFFANSNSTIPPASPLREPFTPPPATATAIPDDWDIMGEQSSPAAPLKQPGIAATPPPPTQEPALPTDAFDGDIFATLDASLNTPLQAQPAQTIGTPVESIPHSQAIDDFLLDDNPAPTAQTMAHQPVPSTPAPAAPVRQAPPPAPQNNEDAALLDAFFRGAGVDAQQLNFADQQALMLKVGLLARKNAEGLMLALRARTTIKSSFRVNKTIIAPVENNPLKFLVTADDVLSTLLSDDRPGYMPAKQAVDEGYSDLQTHQLAMMAGMQATIRAILQQFNPAKLEQSFAGKSGSSIIPGAKKAKNWDNYGKFYGKISDQIADDFQNLFGEEFAKAYEQQVQKLKK